MKRRPPAFLARLAALLLGGALCAAAQAGALKAIVGGTVIDGLGSTPIHNGVVLIDGERIRAVGPRSQVEVPPDAEVISAEGMTVLPGLWDLQVHLTRLGHGDVARWNETYLPLADRVITPLAARQLLLAGVTSARDVESPLSVALNVRERVRAKRIPGPTLYVGGPSLTRAPAAGSWQWNVSDVEDARAKARKLADAGVDYLLLADLDLWSSEELLAAIAEARSRGLPVHAQAGSAAAIERGLAAQVDGFLGTGPGAQPAFPDTVVLALRQRLLSQPNKPVFWSPGASAVFSYERLRDDAEPLDDPEVFAALPAVIAGDVRASLANLDRVSGLDMPTSRRPTLCNKVRQLRDAGAALVAGSDAGVPAHLHSRATWQEIDVWVRECGIDAAYAIQAATHDAAVAMGAQNESGSLGPGKYADVIAVRGNVLLHPALLANPTIVIRHGQRYR
ncbi:MAG: amidohydrolase family protein [Steroidobacteraceae bacterium]|nr:amidohydrolase family protein [Steroidobacteraceae bacterium]MCC7198279.1 amidohydrolase family protein [Gammaproteobacteria bacterium]